MKKNIATFARIMVLASALFGTITRLAISLPGESGWSVLLYFTVQSNLMVCAFLIVETFTLRGFRISSAEENHRLQSIHGAILLYISITGLIYNIMLASGHQTGGLNGIVIQFNHAVTPVLFLADWLIRQKKYTYSFGLILPWLAYPITYLIFGSIEGGITGFFRYPFLNFADQSPVAYLIGMLGVTAFFLILSWLFITLNKFSSRKRGTA